MESIPDDDPLVAYFREHGPYFYLAIDDQGIVRYANRFTQSLLKPPVVGQPCDAIFVHFGAALDVRALADDPTREHLVHVAGANGLPQAIQCRFHVNGDRILALGHVDNREWQNLQRELVALNNELNTVTRDLQKANVQLKRLNELKAAFVAFAGEDVRAPTGVIQMYAQFLLDETQDTLSPAHRHLLGVIHERARAIDSLSDDLLDRTTPETAGARRGTGPRQAPVAPDEEAPSGRVPRPGSGAGSMTDDSRPAVAEINPDAGNHPVPADPRELAACLRAADACWKRFPYYEARYGERGRRFAASDGAWLGILHEFAGAQVVKHVQWLSRVLSSRGMPTLLLQVHLELMFDELVAAVPDRRARYEEFLSAAQALREARCLRIGDDERRTLADGFFAAAGGGWRVPLPDAADVIVAAVVDDVNGHPGALSSVREWMTDPARFSPAWIDAVHALVERAQAAASARG